MKIIILGKKEIYSHKLKLRLIQDKIFNHECSRCLLTTWNNLPIPLELDHINGNHHDNSKENLRLLCPNCHAQTPTYCKKSKTNNNSYTIEELKEAVKNNNSPYQVLVALKLNPKGGGNYSSFFKLVNKHNIDISHFYV